MTDRILTEAEIAEIETRAQTGLVTAVSSDIILSLLASLRAARAERDEATEVAEQWHWHADSFRDERDRARCERDEYRRLHERAFQDASEMEQERDASEKREEALRRWAASVVTMLPKGCSLIDEAFVTFGIDSPNVSPHIRPHEGEPAREVKP